MSKRKSSDQEDVLQRLRVRKWQRRTEQHELRDTPEGRVAQALSRVLRACRTNALGEIKWNGGFQRGKQCQEFKEGKEKALFLHIIIRDHMNDL